MIYRICLVKKQHRTNIKRASTVIQWLHLNTLNAGKLKSGPILFSHKGIIYFTRLMSFTGSEKFTDKEFLIYFHLIIMLFNSKEHTKHIFMDKWIAYELVLANRSIDGLQYYCSTPVSFKI